MNFNNQSVINTAEPFLIIGDEIGCLLVHGFTGTPKEMRPLGEFLGKMGHTVLGVRLAGHATKPEDIVRSQWKDWLLSVEDGLHLLQQTCSKIFIAGLSMGGMLAIVAASQYPLSGIALLSTPYQLPSDWRLRFIGLIKYFMPEVAKGEEDWHDPQNAVGHESYLKYPTASIAELVKLADEMKRCAPKVQIPALLIQSKNDHSVSIDHAENHFKLLGSKDKEILLIENSGHIITEDTDREIVFEKVEEFIHRISSNIT